MKYVVIPVVYLFYAVLWFVMSWIGVVVWAIVHLRFEGPDKFRMRFWHNGCQVLTDVEFSGPFEWWWLTMRNLFRKKYKQ